MKTYYTLKGYFNKKQANRIKEKFQGKTYYNFNVEISNMNGNCKIVISTDYKIDDEEQEQEFKNMVNHYAFNLI